MLFTSDDEYLFIYSLKFYYKGLLAGAVETMSRLSFRRGVICYEPDLIELVGFAGGAIGKETPANAGDVKDTGLTPGLGRSPGGVHGNPLQYSYLEDPMGRGAWQTTVHRVTKSQT